MSVSNACTAQHVISFWYSKIIQLAMLCSPHLRNADEDGMFDPTHSFTVCSHCQNIRWSYSFNINKLSSKCYVLRKLNTATTTLASYICRSTGMALKAGMAHSDCQWTCGCTLQVKLQDPFRTCAIPECFWGKDSRRGAIIKCTHLYHYLYLYSPSIWCMHKSAY